MTSYEPTLVNAQLGFGGAVATGYGAAAGNGHTGFSGGPLLEKKKTNYGGLWAGVG